MIPRRIVLQKTGSNEYMCSGNSCNICKLRFECFTEDFKHFFLLDWDKLHGTYKGSPSIVLKQVVGSQVFVKGSNKFKKLLHERVSAYIVKPDEGVVAQQAEVIG